MQVKSFLCVSIIAATVSLAYCSNNNVSSNSAGNDNDSTGLPSVETQSANTNYKPAFKGQTRINGVKTTTPYKVEKLAGGLGRPWAVVPMPDGRLLITEKTGYMQIHKADGSLHKKITGFPEVDNGGQGGMLDAALDPDFKKK